MNLYDLGDVRITILPNNDIRELYVELTNDCNFHCEMCFRNGFPEASGYMTTKTLSRLSQEIDNLPHLKKIMMGGIGEPLLHPGVFGFITRAKEKGLFVSMTTNGSLLDENIDRIIQSRLDSIYLSFETGDIGHSNEEQIFRVCGRLEQCKEALRAKTPDICLAMVLTRENVEDLPRIAGRLRGSGVSYLFFSNVLKTSSHQDGLTLYPGMEPDTLRKFRFQLSKNAILDKIRCSIPQFEIKTERYCEFVERRSLVVQWDGAITPCYRFSRPSIERVGTADKTVKAVSFGNIADADLLGIWNSRDYAWFRYMVHTSGYPSCIDCQFKDGCQYNESTESDCWGNENSCSDCLWSRGIIRCP